MARVHPFVPQGKPERAHRERVYPERLYREWVAAEEPALSFFYADSFILTERAPDPAQKSGREHLPSPS